MSLFSSLTKEDQLCEDMELIIKKIHEELKL
jgi:hypothetical protein